MRTKVVVPVLICIIGFCSCATYTARRESGKAVDLLYYPGALPFDLREMEVESNKWAALTMSTPDSEAQVLNYYQGLDGKVWTIGEVSTDDNGITLIHLYSEHIPSTVAIKAQGGLTYIVLGMPSK